MTAETIAGYAHVNIVVTDIDAAKAFYGGKLGLELLPRPDFGRFVFVQIRHVVARKPLALREQLREPHHSPHRDCRGRQAASARLIQRPIRQHQPGATPAAVSVSNAHAEAGRRNGAKSRGPTTPEGMARSATR